MRRTERNGLTRKQFLGLAAAAAGAMLSRPREASANQRAVHKEPLIGEPGYDRRMAKLFRSGPAS